MHDRKCWIRDGREMVEPKSNGWDPRFRGLIRGEGKKRCIFFSPSVIQHQFSSVCVELKFHQDFVCVTSTSSATTLLVDPGLCSWVCLSNNLVLNPT